MRQKQLVGLFIATVVVGSTTMIPTVIGAPPAGATTPAVAPILGTPLSGGIVDAPDPDVVPNYSTSSDEVFTTTSMTPPIPLSQRYPIPEWTAQDNGGSSWTTTGDPGGGLASVAGSWATATTFGAVAEAPGVIQIGSTWYMYFAALPRAAAAQGHFGAYCIGIATLPASRDITSTPFTIPGASTRPSVPDTSSPILCDPQNNYTTAFIDPSPFYDPASGNYYLTYKTNNLAGTNGTIYSIQIGGPTCPSGSGASASVRTQSRALAVQGGGGGCTSTATTGLPVSGTQATQLLPNGSSPG